MKSSQLIQVIWEKSRLNLKSEASTNYLSYLWWFLEPVIQMACYYTVFELLLGRGGPGYVYFLLVGLVPWLWFSRVITQASNSLFSGRALMDQLDIPKVFFPAVVVVQCTVKQILVFAVLIVFLIIAGKPIQVSWLYAPVLFLVQLTLMVPLAFLAAISVAFVSDLKHVIPTLVQFLFFMSGVFFDLEAVTKQYYNLVYLNPMAGLIDSYRSVLIEGTSPDWGYLTAVAGGGLVLSIMMIWVFNKQDKNIARVVQE